MACFVVDASSWAILRSNATGTSSSYSRRRSFRAMADTGDISESRRRVVQAGVVVGAALLVHGLPCLAISGGGKDFASKDWSGDTTTFVGGSFVGKDFSGAVARETSFAGADLRGARFFKANLRGADFSGCDLRGASLEGASLKDANFSNANMTEAYLTETFVEVGSLSGTDLTDAFIPPFILPKLCARSDVEGQTREALMCE